VIAQHHRVGRCQSLFATMHLNANLPAAYFGVPAGQVVEVGLEIEM
jgi:KUP system potassium uptake protein